MSKKVTNKNYTKVLANFKLWLDTLDKDELKLTCEEFNSFLDDLKDNDVFGTEGQLDPRGDNRN